MYRNLVPALSLPLLLLAATLVASAPEIRAAQTPSSALFQPQNDANPSVTDVTRDVGPRRGGAMVTITGQGLAGASVTIDGKKAFVVSTSGQKIVIVTPPGRRGRRDMVIRTPGGGRATSRYTYL